MKRFLSALLCLALALGALTAFAQTYTGEADGMHGPVKVEFEVADGKITKVTVVSHDENPDYGVPAVDQLPAKIVEKGDTGVDVIAGSTFTSKAILKAIDDALAAAATAEAPAAGEAPVVYTGEADGMHGPVKVEFEVTDGKITKVTVVSHDENPDYGVPAVDQLPAKIVEKGDTGVDVIAGSTFTSKAILKAIDDALAAAATAEQPAEAPAEQPAETPAEVPAEPAAVSGKEVFLGLGIDSLGRVGPGKDDKEVQVYSFNQVFAAVLFDADGRILFADLDQLEVATPNYDGDGMPHFAGFPGQLPYLYDSDHDGKVDGVLATDDEAFKAEVSGWMTKRERGEGYKMSTGTWASQMDAYQAFFVGKTVAELEEWFAKYTSDHNGRPLKDGSTNEKDKAKYDALSAEDKAMLADVTASATMSLNDSHGNILAALKAADGNRVPVAASAASLGLGLDFTGRIGPGKDNTETQVYSINEVVAVTLLDAEGKILQAYLDQVEVATPNYDGDGMPHFSGFPGQGGYNFDLNHDGVVDGKLVTHSDGFLAEVSGWMTKRERGEGYKMNTGTWASQMDAYQAFFAGKTIDELDAWFAKYTSDHNGRPLKDGSTNEKDKAKYDALSAEDKAMLADVTSAATMSLNDSHGNILAALRDSVAKQVKVAITVGE